MMSTRQARRPGRSSMVQSTGGMLMLGLACCAVQVCAAEWKAKTRSNKPPSVPKIEGSGTTEVMRPFVKAVEVGTCMNTCKFARDGVCDDRRALGVCPDGTDCQDCGPWGKSNFTQRPVVEDHLSLDVYADLDEAFHGKSPKETDVVNQRTTISGRRSAPTSMKHHAEPMHGDDPIHIREQRLAGKRALEEACSDSVEFARCHHDKGSALQLEKCLLKRDSSVSGRCADGIEAWKSLLIETAPGARNIPPALGKELANERESSQYHAAAEKAKKYKPSLVDKRAVGRGASKNGVDHKRTSHVHETSTTLKRGDSIKSSSPSTTLRGGQGDGRGGAPHHIHDKKQHALHSRGASRSHHHSGNDGGKRVGHWLLVIVAYLSMVLTVVYVVARVDKRLVRHTDSHRGASGDGAPGGYQALPEDDAASGSVERDYVNDDDAVVVTGTPVNPPPSVHL